MSILKCKRKEKRIFKKTSDKEKQKKLYDKIQKDLEDDKNKARIGFRR